MPIQLTSQQLQAYEAMDRRILVSAAAGSGKTAVLIERVLRLLREGVPLKRMLIITYTNAAAGELRDRLRTNLMEQLDLFPDAYGKALDVIEDAQISTIHTFGKGLLEEYFETADVDTDGGVANDAQSIRLKQKAWRTAMNGLLESREPCFMTLCDAFSNRQLEALTIDTYEFMMSLDHPFDWMDRCISETEKTGFRDTVWYGVLERDLRLRLQEVRQQLTAMERLMSGPDVHPNDYAAFSQDRMGLLHALDTPGEDVFRVLHQLSRVDWAPTPRRSAKWSDEEKEVHDQWMTLRSALKDTVKEQTACLRMEDQLQLQLENTRPLLRGLKDLVRAFYACYRQLKKEAAVIDYHDMEQGAAAILDVEDIRQQVRSRYDHVFVDEFQDVSNVQFGIIGKVTGPDTCLFMVGDPKQSIYRFRNADPTIFMRMSDTGAITTLDGTMPVRVIWLQANFRSTPNILMTANVTFESCMRRQVTELDYGPNDLLRNPKKERAPGPLCEMHLVPRTEGVKPLLSEAQVVVSRIQALLQTPVDPQQPEGQKYRYRDMTILLGEASTSGPILAEYLQQQGVPVFYDGKTNYYDLLQIRQMKALLQAIDNQWQDIPLITALRLVPFCFDEAQLAAIRLLDNRSDVTFASLFHLMCGKDTELGRKCLAARQQLETWNLRQALMPLDDFLWLVYRESGYYARCGAMERGQLHQANLRMLTEKAAMQEKRGRRSLREFLDMITDESRSGDNHSAHVLGDNDDLVTIMTMHKSKGLQFPVVFLMKMADSLDRKHQEAVLFHQQLGISLPWVDPVSGARMPHTVLRDIFQRQMEMEERSERCRLMYVAMTRPRDRLIVTGTVDGGAEPAAWRMPEGDLRVQKAGSMLDWMLQPMFDLDPEPVTEQARERQNWVTVAWPAPEQQEQARRLDQQDLRRLTETLLQDPAPDSMLWWDRQEDRQAAPVKLSVSTLVHRGETEAHRTEEDETPESKRESADLDQPPRPRELPRMPLFMMEQRPAATQIGTAMHHLLMLLPLEPLRGLPTGELQRAVDRLTDSLVTEGVLPVPERGLINTRRIVDFLASPLGQRVLASPEVHREWAFNLWTEEHGLTDEAGAPLTGRVLLQGIIDNVFLEDGAWVLLDYKTDRFRDQEAFMARHRDQRNWYARALETLTGRPVKEIWLFALTYGLACRLR